MKKVCIDCGGDVFFKYGSTEMWDSHGIVSYRCWNCMRARVERMIEENRIALRLETRSTNP